MTPTTVRPSLTVDEVLIDDLRPNPVNPGRISDEELDSLERSLRQFGFVQPVLARREDRTVIGGPWGSETPIPARAPSVPSADVVSLLPCHQDSRSRHRHRRSRSRAQLLGDLV
jgi:hypothetical protein